MKLADMHTHTTKSDGTLTPTELVRLARDTGLAAVAITDHDTVAGISEAQTAGEKLGVEVVAGVEMGTGWEHTEIHLLGYFIDPASPALKPALDWVIKDRRQRNEKMAEIMRADGIDVTTGELYSKYPQSTVGRPHFAVKLMECGRASSVKDAFERFLAPGQKYYVRRNFIPFADAVGIIHAAGGKAVLAHPFQYKFDDQRLRELLDYCKSIGVDGVECLYSGYTAQQEKYLKKLAEEYGFLITGGSDFHGAHKPHISLGSGTGGLSVPYELLEKLR